MEVADCEIKALFDQNGNCPTLGDPFRNRTPTAEKLFDEEGYLHMHIPCILKAIVLERPVQPMCMAVRMLVADEFAGNTKGNYATIYLWR
jgi:hypothetical protein